MYGVEKGKLLLFYLHSFTVEQDGFPGIKFAAIRDVKQREGYMDFREFGAWVKENHTLKVMKLQLDKSFTFKLYVIFLGIVFTLLSSMIAIDWYFECRTKGMGCFDSFMYSAFIFVVAILAQIILAYLIYCISVFVGSWLDGYFASRRLRKSIEQAKQDIQPELPPINEELLAEYMSAEFRGLGGHHNYMPEFLKDLEELRNDTNTEILRVATLLYDSKALATEPKSYKKWVEDFFNILGRKSPANPSRTKSMPTKQIINQYYYIDIPNN